MRRLAVYVSLVGVLLASLVVGWVLADWPNVCRGLGWCGSGFFPR